MAGLHLARIALDNIDVFNRNLQDIGGDLRKRRVVAVTLTH